VLEKTESFLESAGELGEVKPTFDDACTTGSGKWVDGALGCRSWNSPALFTVCHSQHLAGALGESP